MTPLRKADYRSTKPVENPEIQVRPSHTENGTRKNIAAAVGVSDTYPSNGEDERQSNYHPKNPRIVHLSPLGPTRRYTPGPKKNRTRQGGTTPKPKRERHSSQTHALRPTPETVTPQKDPQRPPDAPRLSPLLPRETAQTLPPAQTGRRTPLRPHPRVPRLTRPAAAAEHLSPPTQVSRNRLSSSARIPARWPRHGAHPRLHKGARGALRDAGPPDCPPKAP